jgi:hypothetical protein
LVVKNAWQIKDEERTENSGAYHAVFDLIDDDRLELIRVVGTEGQQLGSTVAICVKREILVR